MKAAAKLQANQKQIARNRRIKAVPDLKRDFVLRVKKRGRKDNRFQSRGWDDMFRLGGMTSWEGSEAPPLCSKGPSRFDSES